MLVVVSPAKKLNMSPIKNLRETQPYFAKNVNELVSVVRNLSSDNLKELWSFETNTGINAPPITFAVDGKQYVAILAGLGGAWPKWFMGSTPGLEKVDAGQMLFVFSL